MKRFLSQAQCVIILGLIILVSCSPAIRSEDAPTVTREQIDEWMIGAGEAYAEEQYAEAIELYTHAADHGNAWGQNNLAWIRATFKDPDYRDGKLAVLYALKATEQQPENSHFFRTLAAAYARDEQFDKAIEAQRHAIKVLPDDAWFSEETKAALLDDNQAKLELYTQHKAYVDTK